jgi:hypothetical protein
LNALQTVGYRELFSYLKGNSAYNLLSKKKIQGVLPTNHLVQRDKTQNGTILKRHIKQL